MATFNLLGEIVADDSAKYFQSDIVPAIVVGWLKGLEDNEDVEIFINSPGGSVVGGLAIANAIKSCGHKTTAHVAGLAASMASVIACACDEIVMDEGAFMMIHNPWGMVAGEAEELRKQADLLDQMKTSLISFYQTKFDKTSEQISDMMDAETWFSGAEAEANGLLCTVIPTNKEVALAASVTSLHLAHAPEAALKFIETRDRTPVEKTEEPVAQTHVEASQPVTDWEARYKGASKKINEMQEAVAAANAARDEAIARADAEYNRAHQEFECQLQESQKALADANAKCEQLTAEFAQATQALAEKDEHLAKLQTSHAQLTSGVLTATDAPLTYEEKLAAAKSPEEKLAIVQAYLKK